MPTTDEAMDQHIADDLRALIDSLSALGFAPKKYEYLKVFPFEAELRDLESSHA
jgi:hypothetical protein